MISDEEVHMASYYYLVSSLPTLSSDGEMPMTYGEFLKWYYENHPVANNPEGADKALLKKD